MHDTTTPRHGAEMLLLLLIVPHITTAYKHRPLQDSRGAGLAWVELISFNPPPRTPQKHTCTPMTTRVKSSILRGALTLFRTTWHSEAQRNGSVITSSAFAKELTCIFNPNYGQFHRAEQSVVVVFDAHIENCAIHAPALEDPNVSVPVGNNVVVVVGCDICYSERRGRGLR